MMIPTFRQSDVISDNQPVVYAELPIRKTTEAFCFDVCAFSPDGPIELPPLTVVKVRTGIHVALPSHSAILVCSRSGLAAKGIQVINAPGVIDSDYRDEIAVLLCYIAPPAAPSLFIQHGERIAQFLYMPPMEHPTFTDRGIVILEDLPRAVSNRIGGFGSTGV